MKAWNDILARGVEFDIKPCGLGARDTLRLEMCYPLNGNDLSPHTTPIEAGLGIFVVLQKHSFIGRETLARQRAEGVAPARTISALTGACPRRARTTASSGGAQIAETTSGSLSPTLKAGIGVAHIPTDTRGLASRLRSKSAAGASPALIEKKPLHRPAATA